MQTRQTKSHSPNTAPTKAAEPQKMAVSAASASRVPAWASGGENSLPTQLLPEGQLIPTAGPQSDGVSDQIGNSVNSGNDVQGTQTSEESSKALTSRMESAFGMSFDNIHLRTDEAAERKASNLHAKAYTDGKEIGFAKGKFNPGTPEGDFTLAHEFAHVAQKRGGMGGKSGLVMSAFGNDEISAQSEDGEQNRDILEADANSAAKAVLNGETPQIADEDTLAVLTQPEQKSSDDRLLTPPRNRYFLIKTPKMLIYYFNIEDYKQWSDSTQMVIRYYFRDSFISNDDTLNKVADDFNKSGLVQAEERTPVHKWNKPYAVVGILPSFQMQVLAWMSTNHPDIEPKKREVSTTHKLSAHGGEKEGKGGVVKFEPLGKLELEPKLPTYISGSKVTAFVWFDESDPDRMFLNYFPERAEFNWSITQNGKKIDSSGSSKYEFTAPDPGTYFINVIVTSRYFVEKKRLEKSIPIVTVAESVRQQEVFNELLVDDKGNDARKPFIRDKDGTIRFKPNIQASSVEDQITYINIQKGAINELLAERKLSKDEGQKYLDSFDEQLKDLKKIRDQVASQKLYMIRGTFVSAEDSSSTQISAFMQQEVRERRDNTAYYKVVLYDATLNPGKLVQHAGEGKANVAGGDEAKGFTDAELDAIVHMKDHWQTYNEYPNGTIHLAIQTLEANQIRDVIINTRSGYKTAKKILTGIAVIGGIVVLAASAVVTGGTTAALGVMVLEGVVAGATVGEVALKINERVQTGTFKVDKDFAMDMLQLATVVLGAFGSFAKAFATTERISSLAKPMLVANLSLGTGTLALIGLETRDQIIATEAYYTGLIGQEQDPKKRQDLEDKKKAAIAQILGAAAVSGGLMLISMGMSAKHLGEGKAEADASTERKPPPPPEGETKDNVPPGSVGAMRRYEYEASPKHGATQRGNIAPAPKNGQAALDNSVQVKSTSPRRVGIDYEAGEIVVFDETHPGKGVYHGHTRTWEELTPEMRKALIESGYTDRRGQILTGDQPAIPKTSKGVPEVEPPKTGGDPSEERGGVQGGGTQQEGTMGQPGPSRTQDVPIEKVRYSQSDISPETREGQTIEELAASMRKKGFDPKEAIDVVDWGDGEFQTLDHRRLAAAKLAGLEKVPAKVHNPGEKLPPELRARFKFREAFRDPVTGKTYRAGALPENWGEAAMGRAAKQGKDFPLRGSKTPPPIRGTQPPS